MGLMQDKSVAEFHDALIEVEANATLAGSSSRLTIANEKQDDNNSKLGEHWIRGRLTHHVTTRQVQIAVGFGFFETKYRLLVDRREHAIQRIK